MGQEIFPLFIEGENNINNKISYETSEDNTIYYYLYCNPVAFHAIDDNIQCRGLRYLSLTGIIY